MKPLYYYRTFLLISWQLPRSLEGGLWSLDLCPCWWSWSKTWMTRVFSVSKQDPCFVQNSDVPWMVPGHMKGLGQLVAVFSVDDIVVSHKGNLWEPREGHCPREVTQGRSYLGLLISGLNFPPKLSLQKPHSDLGSKWKDVLSTKKNQTGKRNSLNSEKTVILAKSRTWCVCWGGKWEWAGGAVNTHSTKTNFWNGATYCEPWQLKKQKVLSLKVGNKWDDP